MRLVVGFRAVEHRPHAAPTPLVAVLEVSGAVLSWAVDDPAAVAQITFTDLARADWLWRVLGESGHVALAAALDGRRHPSAAIELTGVDVRPGSLEPLRRLALGHWLRRWWPASQRDGIAVLDGCAARCRDRGADGGRARTSSPTTPSTPTWRPFYVHTPRRLVRTCAAATRGWWN